MEEKKKTENPRESLASESEKGETDRSDRIAWVKVTCTTVLDDVLKKTKKGWRADERDGRDDGATGSRGKGEDASVVRRDDAEGNQSSKEGNGGFARQMDGGTENGGE